LIAQIVPLSIIGVKIIDACLNGQQEFYQEQILVARYLSE